jgi:hypothetical protein
MFIGILLLVVGTVGFIVGMIGIPLQFTSTMLQAVTPTAAELCNPGETLDEVTGQEEYTPLEGYRHAVRYFCVNAEGVRREVTGTFVTGMIGDTIRSLGGFLIPVLASCLCTVGFFLTLFGWLFARRNTLQMVTPNNFVFPDETFVVTQSDMTATSEGRKALTAKLHQLEDARQAGMISEEEYQRLRREALDNIT